MAKVSVVTCDGDGCGKTVAPGAGYLVRIANYPILSNGDRAAMAPRTKVPRVRMIEKDLCQDCTEELMGVD